jgi:hypothetical protein
MWRRAAKKGAVTVTVTAAARRWTATWLYFQDLEASL